MKESTYIIAISKSGIDKYAIIRFLNEESFNSFSLNPSFKPTSGLIALSSGILIVLSSD